MALDFTDFDGLVEAVAHTLNRTDLDDDIAGWIQLAEDRHRTDVRIREMLTRVEQEIDGRLIALPTGFLEMKRLRVLAATGEQPYQCDQVTADVLTTKWRSASQVSIMGRIINDRPINLPRHFAVEEQIEFEVDPSEFTGFDHPLAEMLFYKQLTPLSEDDPSNALLVRAPGAYFYGTLVHSAPFLEDDERVQTWETAYGAIVGQLNALDRKRAGPLIARTAGSTP